MEEIGQVLTAGGALGMVLVFIFGLIVFLVLPIAAIIDCATSRVQGAAKAFIIIVLVLTWGVVSLVYCLFFAQSRRLRQATAAAVMAAVLTVVVSSVALYKGSDILQTKQAAREVAEQEQLVSAFRPATINSQAIAPFEALHALSPEADLNTVVLTTFTLDGADLAKGISIDSRIQDIAVTSDRCYAITDHDIGTLSRRSGQFVTINLKTVFPDFGWPSGIAYDGENQRIVVITSHVYNRFYAYSTATGEWTQLGQGNRGTKLQGLTFDGDRRALFSIVEPTQDSKVSRLAWFSLTGSLVGYFGLRPEIPIADGSRGPLLQINAVSGHLILIVPHHSNSKMAIYAIDPDTGEVKRRAMRQERVNVTE